MTEIDADHDDDDDEKAAVLSEALALADSECKTYILDIDLDYFSTWNPFLQGIGISSLVHSRRGCAAHQPLDQSLKENSARRTLLPSSKSSVAHDTSGRTST